MKVSLCSPSAWRVSMRGKADVLRYGDPIAKSDRAKACANVAFPTSFEPSINAQVDWLLKQLASIGRDIRSIRFLHPIDLADPAALRLAMYVGGLKIYHLALHDQMFSSACWLALMISNTSVRVLTLSASTFTARVWMSLDLSGLRELDVGDVGANEEAILAIVHKSPNLRVLKSGVQMGTATLEALANLRSPLDWEELNVCHYPDASVSPMCRVIRASAPNYSLTALHIGPRLFSNPKPHVKSAHYKNQIDNDKAVLATLPALRAILKVSTTDILYPLD